MSNRNLAAILFADIAEGFIESEIKGDKCTFDTEVTLTPLKDGRAILSFFVDFL